MQLTIDKKAQAWFEEEMGVSKERGVRFLGKVYGCSPIHEGFSLAVEVDAPSKPYVSVEENGITYFVETGDEIERAKLQLYKNCRLRLVVERESLST